MGRWLSALGAAALLTSGSAFAADLGHAPPPAPPPAPLFTWTGFYLGGNVGGAWGNAGTITELAPVLPTDEVYNGSEDLSPLGSKSVFTGGVQVGYNYQISQIVLGVEADINALSYNVSAPQQTPAGVVSTGGDTVGSRKANTFGTLRGRLGFAAFDRALIYVTGGAAFSDLRHSVLDTCTVAPCGPATESGSLSVNTGWTFGGGLEYALTRNWTIKAEYLYARFNGGQFRTVSNVPIAGKTVLYNATATDLNILRLGVNYRF